MGDLQKIAEVATWMAFIALLVMITKSIPIFTVVKTSQERVPTFMKTTCIGMIDPMILRCRGLVFGLRPGCFA